MRKFLSIILVLSMICTFGLTALAEEITFSYSIPNTMLGDNLGTRNYIGVNQQTIKLIYSGDVTQDILNSITFTDAGGNVPVGGVVKTADGNIVTLKFGELSENTVYKVSENENVIVTYNTLAKQLTNEDFSKWETGDVTPSDSEFQKLNGSSLYVKADNSSTKMEVKNSLLYVTSNSSNNAIIGSYLGNNAVTDAKIITKMKFAAPEINAATTAIGGIWSWNFQTDGYEHYGVLTSNSGWSGFEKSQDNLYDVTVTTSIEETAAESDTQTSARFSTVVNDNLSNASLTLNSKKTLSNSKVRLNSVSAVKFYYADSIAVASVKTGFYTVPAPLGEPMWDENAKTLKYVINTDIDTEKSSISIGNLPTSAAYNKETRELTLSYSGDIINSYNYTVNFTNLVSEDGISGEEDVFFCNGIPAERFNVLYTSPSADTGSGFIGVNQGTIKIMFEENIKSGVDYISFTDSKGREPVGGILKTIDGADVTLKFGELSENETYSLTVPDNIVGISGNCANPASYTFKTASKNIVNEDFSKWETGDVTPSDSKFQKLNGSSAYIRLTPANTIVEVKDSLLQITNATESETLFGTYLGRDYYDAEVITRVKFSEPEQKSITTAFGGMWCWHFQRGSYSYDGMNYNTVSNKFSKNNDGLYDITIKNKKYNTVLETDKTASSVYETTVFDNLSENFCQESVNKTLEISSSKFDSVSALKLYHADSVGIASINSGFYTLPKLLTDPVYNPSEKTIYLSFNTDIVEESLKNIKLDGKYVNAVYESAERKAVIHLSSELSFCEHSLSLDGVISSDDFLMNEIYTIKNDIAVENVRFLSKNGEEVKAFYDDVLTAEFSVKNYGAEKKISAVFANYNNGKLVQTGIKHFDLTDNFSGKITLENVYRNKNASAALMFWSGMTPLTEVYSIFGDESKYMKISYKDIYLSNNTEILTPYNIEGLSQFDLSVSVGNYTGVTKECVITADLYDSTNNLKASDEITVNVAEGLSEISEIVSFARPAAEGDILKINFMQDGEKLLKNEYICEVKEKYQSVSADLSEFADKRTILLNQKLNSNGDNFDYEFEGTGFEIRADVNNSAMRVYVDGEFKETVDLYSGYVSGNKTVYMISGLSEGTHLVRIEKVGGEVLSLNEILLYTRDIRIACIGDSLTYGVDVYDYQKYPYQLSQHLGEGYEVGNFGKPGASVKKRHLNSNYGYITDYGETEYASASYAKSLEFLPDIAVIMLGTNDCNYTNQPLGDIEGIKDEYKEIISKYEILETNPQIILNTPPAICDNKITFPHLNNVNMEKTKETVYEIGSETNNFVIDIYSATYGMSDDCYRGDGLHLTESGYAVVANEVYDSLCIPKESFSAKICSLKDDKTSLYTFTSDDGYINAVQWFDSEFSEKGLKGTVVLIHDYIDRTGNIDDRGTVEEWNEIFDAGRIDLASHSTNHLLLTDLDDAELTEQITNSLAYLKADFPDQDILFFGTPYNQTNDTVQNKIKESFAAARSGEGFNSIAPSDNDWYTLKYQIVDTDDTLETMNGWVDTAIEKGQWLMELWHGVEDDNWSPPTKANASAHFTHISNQKTMWSATINEAIKYLKERQSSKISNEIVKTDEFSFNLTDTLPDNVFNYPLSVKIKVPHGCKQITVYQGKNFKKYNVTDNIAVAEIIPDGGYIRIAAE